MKNGEKRDLVFQLRGEVREVKDCFARFVIQGAALAVALAGFILGVGGVHEHRAVGLAAVPGIIILMLICRVGIFKYTTVNRNLGYELHLDRLSKYAQIGDQRTKERVAKLEGMGWEEALRAWRVVQASIFAKIYKVPQIKADRSRIWPASLDPGLYKLKGNARKLDSQAWNFLFEWGRGPYRDGPYAWWNQKKLTELYDAGGTITHFHTGNFLKDVLYVLNLLQWSLFALLSWSGIAWLWSLRSEPSFRLYAGIVIIPLLAGGLIIAYRQLRIKRRRLILEEELGSIHSCAITWAAVAIVHFAAAEATSRPYCDYTVRLARLCSFVDPTMLPILVGRDIWEGKLFFDRRVYSRETYEDPLLSERRQRERRVASLPPPNGERRKKERRAA